MNQVRQLLVPLGPFLLMRQEQFRVLRLPSSPSLVKFSLLVVELLAFFLEALLVLVHFLIALFLSRVQVLLHSLELILGLFKLLLQSGHF